MEKQLLLKQADIAMLQSQIDPHFLYNTLECIRGMAVEHGSYDICAMAEALATFFRYSISIRSNVVPLMDELEHIRNYVTIQQYRFPKRFRLTIEADRQDHVLMEALIPKLTLQPIVENCIIHGFRDIVSGGVISITAERTQTHLDLTIEDNGKGMSDG